MWFMNIIHLKWKFFCLIFSRCGLRSSAVIAFVLLMCLAFGLGMVPLTRTAEKRDQQQQNWRRKRRRRRRWWWRWRIESFLIDLFVMMVVACCGDDSGDNGGDGGDANLTGGIFASHDLSGPLDPLTPWDDHWGRESPKENMAMKLGSTSGSMDLIDWAWSDGNARPYAILFWVHPQGQLRSHDATLMSTVSKYEVMKNM